MPGARSSAILRQRAPGRDPEAGLTLVELLVSMTILVIAATIALVLYDGARRSFHVGENVSEQQQAVRIAFDLVASDLRMAGFNTNPDGNEARPDEQIEAAYDTAIVLRADFDAGDLLEAHAPEDTLGGPGSAFLTVSTGNDEIRAYVLAKPDGTDTGTLTFSADVGQTVRDGNVEGVSIPNVALVHNDPPYTLYRVTLDAAAAPQRTVLIENVRSMRFIYYDATGSPIAAVGGAENESSLRARASIRRVGLEIEALTRDPDREWFDPTDTDPDTRAYRKFRLASDISPRNLGRMGIKDFQADTTPPTPPGAPQLYVGHCGGLYITWPPNPPQDETAYYRLRFGTAPGALDGHRAVDATEYYLGGLADSVRYYVALQAIDSAGNQSALGATSSIVTQNINVPERPVNVTVSDGQPGRIDIQWDEVTANTAGTTGDPQSPLLRELAGYRVYRDESAGFTPGPANRIADEYEIGAVPAPILVDRRIVNCSRYYYAVTAVDRCGRESAPSTKGNGRSSSAVAPATPQDVQAFFAGALTNRVRWSAVSQDVNGDEIFVKEYQIYRTSELPEGSVPSVPGDFSYRATVSGDQVYDDTVALSPGDTIFYSVRAKDACPNYSDFSAPAEPTCYFSGALHVSRPHSNERVWGDTEIRVSVLGGIGPYVELRLSIERQSTGETTDFTFPGPGPVWTMIWDARPPGFPEESYRIVAEVDQQNGPDLCTATATSRPIVGQD